MKLHELFSECLNASFLAEMARERRNLRDTITNNSTNIFNHILICYMLDYPQGINHWQQEINNWFLQIQNSHKHVKGRAVEFDTLYQWFMFTSDGLSLFDESYIEFFKKTTYKTWYSNVPIKNLTNDRLVNVCSSVIQKALREISKQNFSSIKELM